MSYDHNVYAGWYVSFSPSTRKKVIGTEKVRRCPTSKKHPTKGQFCPDCGKPIEVIEKDTYQSYGKASFLLDLSTEQDVRDETLGLCGLNEVKAVGDAYVIFPEFLSTQKVILFAPGYACLSDVGRNDGEIVNINPENQVKPEWIEAVKTLFDVQDVQLHFGMVSEVI